MTRHPPVSLVVWASTLLFAVSASAVEVGATAPSATSSATPDAPPQLAYQVGRISVSYARSHPDLPEQGVLLNTEVELDRVGATYVPPTATRPQYSMKLHELQDVSLSAEAVVTVSRAVVAELNRRGIYGVWVSPHSEDIDPRTGRDLRTGREDLRLVVSAVEVRRLRTIAKGTRVPVAESTNHPAYRRLAKNSPLQPAAEGRPGSLLIKDQLDDYVGRLNRFPGRSALAALSSADQGAGIALDYIVSEGRPWTVYAQVANTGTEASGDWRERLGFVHQQLTGHDDILAVDYVTADFEHSHAFFGSYGTPLIYPDRLRAKAYGSYAEYTADELSLSLVDLRGSSWSAGGEMVFSPLGMGATKIGRLSFAPFYLDFTLGARWQGVQTYNATFDVDVGTDFLLPYVGLNFSSVGRETRLTMGLQIEGNLADVAGTDRDDLANLGRLDTDSEWVLAQWGAGFSFFLDPLFVPHAEKLAHELWFSIHGQNVFGDRRLVPQEAELIGGFYSVRGYPEAFDLGDNVFVGSAEYRFYPARALRPALEEKRLLGAKDSARPQFANPFRFPYNDAFRRTDYEVILRAFVDGGETHNNRARPTETDRSLLSTGVGIEVQLRRNLNIRCDYGIVLLSERENLAEPVDYGDSRVHFSATVAW